MNKLILYRLVQCVATYHFLSCFVVFLALEMNEASGKSPVKTKLLLQNIRTHLAQRPDEIVKEKECGSGLNLCKGLQSEEEEEEEQRIKKDLSPSSKPLGARLKPVKVKPKSVIQTVLPKALGALDRKPQRPRKSGSYRKFIHSPDAVNFSEANDKSDEKTFSKSSKPFQEPKRPLDTFKQSFRFKQKFPTTTSAKYPKVGTNFQNAPLLPSIKQTLKRKTKLEGEKTDLKIHRVWTKGDEETNNEAKGKRRAGAKAGERERQQVFAFPNEPFAFVSDSDSSQRNVCRKHTQFYLKHLKKYEIWALTMYDSSAKLPSGILRGNINQYGDFDECLSINVVLKKAKDKWKSSWGIRGKYCLANIDMRTESESTGLGKVQERAESFRFIKSTIDDPGHFIPRFSTINWGLCVPSACLADDVEKFLKSRFQFLNNSSGLVFDVKVDDANCVVKEDLNFKFHFRTTMTALLYLAVLSLSLYATYFDAKAETPKVPRDENLDRVLEESAKDIFRQDNSRGRQLSQEKHSEPSAKGKAQIIVAAFSLRKNVDKLFTDTNRGGIECINGLKSIFTVLLYFAHKTIPLAMTPFINRVALTKISNEPMTVVLRASIVYTDSFLLISGMLTAYSLAKEMSEKKKISWVKKAVGRFIRLTPPLLAVVLFYAYIWHQMGSGPAWNLIVARNSFLCQQYFWRNLLYVQNLFDFENMCAPQTHQLALDMQLSLLAPLFVHLMHKHDKVGIGALQALFILSSIMRYTTTFNNNLSVVIYHGMPVAQLYKTANLLYVQALHRASPYVMGTVVGYHLKKFEKQLHLPKALAAVGWAMALAFGYYSLASPSRLTSPTYRYNVQEAAQYAALSPVAWSLALSWIIVACHLGFGGKLNEFLCHKIFLVFSRISYSVYLTQFLVFFYEIGVKKNPEIFTLASSFSVTEFIIVIVVSVIVTLLVDIPAMEIKKIILDGKSRRTFLEESSDQSETLREEDDRRSETVSGEDFFEENTEEMSEDIEDDGGNEEEIDESAQEEGGDDNDEMIEAIFEIRPLKRFSRTRFSDEPEDKEPERKVRDK